ncbi:hypothetical protein BGZ65_002098 [Modicella reniformis]|uniref:Flavin-containing monooxygenase n=1 Tax=Modicella reniformis TaxID=1440133 RepID=A0A9P6ILX0_9FUNG|nr:hypothetical protein BGZ65_002098 [Modicella reniformis]
MGFAKSFKDGTTPSIAIIGAGLSGICAAIQLQRQLQLTTYKVFELEADVGGTWFRNTYPGCQSDAPAHLYSYSFAPNYDFSKKFVPQSEVLAYLRATAKTYNIYDKILLQTRVSSMQWNEGRKKWILHWVKSATGEEGDHEADVVIHGAGMLRYPKVPKEFDAFKGDMWHSARWNHSVDLTGKRVGVVGTSASGIQIVSTIADRVESLEVYGRSPVYVTPQLNITYNRVWQFLFRHVYFIYTLYRTFWYYYVDSTILLYHKLAWFSAFHRAVVYFVTWLHRFLQLPFDNDLRRKVTPDYELATRRIVLSDKFFPTLKKPNVTLHRDPIVTISGGTIETKSGSKCELDILVLATGFDWISNFPVGYWIGRGGTDIATNWGESPTTYYGTCVPKAPNFFLIWGPNVGIVHHALTSLIELQVMYAIRAISHMLEKDIATMEIKQEAVEKFLETLDRRIQRTIFTTKVRSKCRGFWWGSVTEFWWKMKDLHPERFHVEGREGVNAKSLLNGPRPEREPFEEVD